MSTGKSIRENKSPARQYHWHYNPILLGKLARLAFMLSILAFLAAYIYAPATAARGLLGLQHPIYWPGVALLGLTLFLLVKSAIESYRFGKRVFSR